MLIIEATMVISLPLWRLQDLVDWPRHKVDRKCLWPVVHSTYLINQGLDESTLSVCKILIIVAFCCAQDEFLDDEGAGISQALQTISQLSVKVEAEPHKVPTEDAVLLAKYQRHELDACRWLDKILHELTSRRTWCSVEEVMRDVDWTGANEDSPFMSDEGDGASLTVMGKRLSRELKILVSKYGETQVCTV